MAFEPCEPVLGRRAHPGPVAGDEAQLLSLGDGAGRVALPDAEVMELMIRGPQSAIALPGMTHVL